MKACSILAGVLAASTWLAAAAAGPIVAGQDGKLQVGRGAEAPRPRLVLDSTMATWCTACKSEIPQLTYLRSVFKPEELAMYGLPYDEKDRPDQLRAWAAANHTPYVLLADATQREIASVKAAVMANLKMDAVPASFITDADGHVLRARFGPPSVSELRELMRAQESAGKRK
ncbi:MAG TPA: TlpA disulfide reductase family protein [Usitatibacter sp.]|jgi:peroxiredoxin|nr:TlpA disulfide reductase family protein [Usitatibacter sp.]